MLGAYGQLLLFYSGKYCTASSNKLCISYSYMHITSIVWSVLKMSYIVFQILFQSHFSHISTPFVGIYTSKLAPLVYFLHKSWYMQIQLQLVTHLKFILKYWSWRCSGMHIRCYSWWWWQRFLTCHIILISHPEFCTWAIILGSRIDYIYKVAKEISFVSWKSWLNSPSQNS